MSSSDVGVAADGPGKRIDTVALTSDEAGTPTVQRQVVALADATTFANKAKVDASGNIAVAVSNLPGTQPVSGNVGVSSLPGSPAQDGTDATGVSAPAGGVGIRGWLSGIYNKLSNTLTVTISGTPTVSVSNFPGTQPVSGSVSVSNLPVTQPVSGTVTTNDGGTPLTGQSLPTGSGIIGWLSRLYSALTGTLTTNATIQGTPTISVSGTVPTTLSGTPAVSVSNLPVTQPVSGTVAVSSLPGAVAQDGTDSSDANATQATAGVGIRGWLSTLVSLFRSGAAKVTINGTPAVTVSGSVATTLSGTPAVSVSNLPGTQPVSGTVTANVGTGTMPTSVVDGQNATLGSTADAASAFTVVGLLKNLKAALAGTLTISGAVTNSNLDVALSTRLKPADTLTAVTTVGAVTAITNALPTGANTIGAVTNANLDVALSTRLKPADTLAAVTTVAAVTAITNALPAGTNTLGAMKQVAQTPLTATLATNVTSTTPTTGQSVLGYDGAITLEIVAVGTGTQAVTIQIEGSLDNSNWYIIGTAQIDATANPAYTAAAFTLTLVAGATQRHLYAVRDNVAYIRINPTANSLATGLSSSILANPV